MSALEVEFVEFAKPERTVKRSIDPFLAAFAGVLRDNPGRWAKWPRDIKQASTLAAGINYPERGNRWCPQPFQEPEYEARTSRGVLYVRYHPGEQT